MGITISEFKELQTLVDAVIEIPHNYIDNDYGTPSTCPYCFANGWESHKDTCELENLKILARKIKKQIKWRKEFNGFIIPDKEQKMGMTWLDFAAICIGGVGFSAALVSVLSVRKK